MDIHHLRNHIDTQLTCSSILFLYRDQLLSSLKQTHDPRHDPRVSTGSDSSAWCEGAIEHLFEAAQSIGEILSALSASATPVITPYSGFSVFVAAHVNMYGAVSPRYPGGKERAEAEKKANFAYLERLCEFWPVGHNWVCLQALISHPQVLGFYPCTN